jgi:hypothetical protein
VQTHPLAGTRGGGYSGAFSGTFTLKWRQIKSRLIGTITLSSPVSGKSMGGTYQSPGGGGGWSAPKIS